MCDEDEEDIGSIGDEDDEDPNFDDDWDPEQEDEPAIVGCPNCGAKVIEDTQQCPACGDWIVMPTNPWLEKPGWWIVLGLLGSAATIWMLLGL